jgi:predicted extracellular nuclease
MRAGPVLSSYRALVALAAVVGALALAGPGGATSPNIVISQVYGGGGNTGAPYTNDYLELFNRSSTPASLSGWSVQYASATGTGNFASNPIALLSGVLAPGQHYLVQEAGGANGVPLPLPDASGTVNMSASAGKVIVANTTTGLACNGGSTPCTPAQLAQIVDLVGYGNANFFEGLGPAPTLSNTTAGLRLAAGCTETDNNTADFAAGAPNPRNTISPASVCGDDPPSVASTAPANGASDVSVGSNVSITFSEPVDVAGSWYSISCGTSGTHTASVSGGPTTFTLDPGSDFAQSETCTVTVSAAGVTDQDTDDPPDSMAADYVFSFATETPPVPIHAVQGAAHLSPLSGQVVKVLGTVTDRSTHGFWMQDPSPDSDPATSEGLFVFTSATPTVSVGDSVRVTGRVQEFRPGGSGSGNLTTTELSGSPSVTVLSSGNPLPAPVVIGTGGRVPPDTVIEDDASSGNVETSGVFDPDQDGLDFYESLEGMRVQLDNAVAVGPTDTGFGETPVVGDNGANASVRTARGGVLLRPNDGNPERVTLDDLLTPLPSVNVGDHYSASIIGIMDYNFGNPFIEVTTPGLTAIHDGVTRETTDPVAPGELAVSTFNFENLDPGDPQTKFEQLADEIVGNLRSPDLIAGEEVQDNSGPTDNGVVDASQTLGRLVEAIQDLGGPTYEWREIDPVDDQDGGEPGGNIRQVFLFRTDRGLSFVDRPGGDATTPNGVTGSGSSTQLLYSPGRIAPGAGAWNASRKPLAAELSYRGHKLFVIANHFNSKGGDDPLRGRFQPPTQVTAAQRHQQAQLVADFVSSIGAADPSANVVVLGDLNDFEFSETVGILEDAGLHDLMNTLPLNQRYSYDFEGNSQVLDHILVSGPLFARPLVFDPVHVNAEFFDQASDHDPSVVRVLINDPPTAAFNAPASAFAGFPFELSLTNPSGPEPGETFTYAFDCGSGYGAFGPSSTASCPTTDVGDRSVGGKIRDELGAVTEYRGTVHVIVTFDSLCSLVRSYARHQDDADELCTLLDAAEAAGNPKTRANILKSFRNTVDGMTGPQPGKSFTAEQGAQLKLLSTRLS